MLPLLQLESGRTLQVVAEVFRVSKSVISRRWESFIKPDSV